jgi:hypothetical protein
MACPCPHGAPASTTTPIDTTDQSNGYSHYTKVDFWPKSERWRQAACTLQPLPTRWESATKKQSSRGHVGVMSGPRKGGCVWAYHRPHGGVGGEGRMGWKCDEEQLKIALLTCMTLSRRCSCLELTPAWKVSGGRPAQRGRVSAKTKRCGVAQLKG